MCSLAVHVSALQRVSEWRRGRRTAGGLSTSKHCDARFLAPHARNKLEQDGRIFLALRIEEIPVSAGETSGSQRVLTKRCFFQSLERENENLCEQTRETQINYGKLRKKRKREKKPGTILSVRSEGHYTQRWTPPSCASGWLRVQVNACRSTLTNSCDCRRSQHRCCGAKNVCILGLFFARVCVCSARLLIALGKQTERR